MANRFGIASLGFGLGLRADHYDYIVAEHPKTVDWFEVVSENFMESHQGYLDFLTDLRQHYPLVLHGVSLSIGSTDPLSQHYLKKLAHLADTVKPAWISDHLAWTGVNGRNTHDLLPIPYTENSLIHVTERIKKVQDTLGRPLVLENPSTYLEFNESTIAEWEFLARMADMADCALLLDVNNVYVSCYNHGHDAKRYIDALPFDRIVQIHLAGHSSQGSYLLDTHDQPVSDEVWELYRYAIARTKMVSTTIEWDDKIPAFDVLAAELDKARLHASQALGEAAS